MGAIKIKFNDAIYRIIIRDQADQSVMREIFKIREYRAAEEIIKTAAEPIIDAGAHAGFFVLYARALNPKVKIFALEPEPHNAAALRRHLKDNKIKDVRVIGAALASETGEGDLVISPDTHNHRLAAVIPATPPYRGGDKGGVAMAGIFNVIASEAPNRDALVQGVAKNPPNVILSVAKNPPNVILSEAKNPIIRVKTTDFTNFCKTNKIKTVSLLKMDIEGAEYEVVRNLTAGDLARLRAVILEYHAGGESREALERKFRENGFSVQIYPSKFDKKMGFLLARNKR